MSPAEYSALLNIEESIQVMDSPKGQIRYLLCPKATCNRMPKPVAVNPHFIVSYSIVTVSYLMDEYVLELITK